MALGSLEEQSRVISRDDFRSILQRHAEWLQSNGEAGERADLEDAICTDIGIIKGDLRKANLRRSSFTFDTEGRKDGVWFAGANLCGADLSGALLYGAYIDKSNFTHADLRGAKLQGVDFYDTDLSGADLRGANLTGASLIKVSLQQANLTGANVYGVAAWDLKTAGLQQNDLVVASQGDAIVTVDDIEVAQFVYLMLKNEKLRNIIDTITSKVVLILGRFTSERKRVLDALREALRARNYVPIVFDFEPSGKRDLTETVQLLANMAKFVIADITEAKSIPQELSHIIPMLPSVPVQPILLASDRGYAMFEHWRGFNSVLPEFLYENEQHLLNNLDTKLIGPVNTWQKEQNRVAALEEKIKEEQNRVAALQEKIKELEAKHAQ